MILISHNLHARLLTFLFAIEIFHYLFKLFLLTFLENAWYRLDFALSRYLDCVRFYIIVIGVLECIDSPVQVDLRSAFVICVTLN